MPRAASRTFPGVTARWRLEMIDCPCTSGEQPRSATIRDLGSGPEDSDVWIYRCLGCGRAWLRVLYEASDIEHIFASSGKKFTGGSLYDGRVSGWDGLPKRRV
jgi:hypothetical protein